MVDVFPNIEFNIQQFFFLSNSNFYSNEKCLFVCALVVFYTLLYNINFSIVHSIHFDKKEKTPKNNKTKINVFLSTECDNKIYKFVSV